MKLHGSQRRPGRHHLFRILCWIILVISAGGRVGDPGSNGKSALVLAREDRRAGDFTKAIGRLTDYLDEAGTNAEKGEEAEIRLELGLLFWNVGEIEKSKIQYESAKRIACESRLNKESLISNECLKILAEYGSGKAARADGKFTDAIRFFESAIRTAKEIRSKEHEVKCLRHLSLVYWEMNDLDKYLFLGREALALARSLKHKKEEGICLNNIGLYYWKKGDYSTALTHYQDALEIAVDLNDKEVRSLAASNIAIIFLGLGEKEKALKYLLEVKEIDEDLKNDYYLAIDLNNIGLIFKDAENPLASNRYHDSIKYYQEALKLANRISNRKIEREILNNLGQAYLFKREFIKAQDCFNYALNLAKEFHDEKIISTIYLGLGKLCYLKRSISEAQEYFEDIIMNKNSPEIRDILWESYFGLGLCFEEENNIPKAAEYYAKAIESIENIRPNISLDTISSGFIRNKMEVFNRYINLLLRPENKGGYEGDAIFHYIERAKARAFLDSLVESRIDVSQNLTEMQRQQIENIARRIESINARLANEADAPGRFEELASALTTEEDRYLLAISGIENGGRRIKELALSKPVPARLVQEQLDGATALVEYFLGERGSAMVILTSDGIDASPIAPRAEIEGSVKAFIKSVSSKPDPGIDEKAAARRIYSELGLRKIGSIGKKIDNLIIIPDGILHYLPFESMLMPSSIGREKYLIERYRISYAPSSTIFYWLRAKSRIPSAARGILAFGDPNYRSGLAAGMLSGKSRSLFHEMYLELGFDFSRLPRSRKEIREATKFFPSNARKVYLGSEAREKNLFENDAGSFQVIHFACHAFIDTQQPVRSALVLSNDPRLGEDGFLQVRELYHRRIDANLVVLSACQSGRGRIESGEGVLGLPRIFFYVGAQSVVTTLWPVGDELAERFMADFYRHLAEGLSKAAALQKTKIAMIQSSTSNPHEWAGFVLSGEPDQPISFR